MLVVGVTGGIGSGKTAASDHFESLGVPVIDTDAISKELVEPGLPAYNEIVEEFGEKIVCKNGRLNRTLLRKMVFEDRSRKAHLEQILHGRIWEEVMNRINCLKCEYCVVVIPLLAESNRKYPLDRVLVIDAPKELQISRTMQRDRQSKLDIEKIVDAQASRAKRLQHADDVIQNSGSMDEFIESVNAIHKKYVELAKSYA